MTELVDRWLTAQGTSLYLLMKKIADDHWSIINSINAGLPARHRAKFGIRVRRHQITCSIEWLSLSGFTISGKPRLKSIGSSLTKLQKAKAHQWERPIIAETEKQLKPLIELGKWLGRLAKLSGGYKSRRDEFYLQ